MCSSVELPPPLLFCSSREYHYPGALAAGCCRAEKKLADPQSTNYTYVRVGADTKQKERVAIASPNSI